MCLVSSELSSEIEVKSVMAGIHSGVSHMLALCLEKADLKAEKHQFFYILVFFFIQKHLRVLNLTRFYKFITCRSKEN